MTKTAAAAAEITSTAVATCVNDHRSTPLARLTAAVPQRRGAQVPVAAFQSAV